MRKTIIYISKAIILIAVCYLLHFIYINVKYSYHIEIGPCKTYQWVFKDSIVSNLDSNVSVGSIRNRDAMYHYVYKKSYFICIWEFKDLNSFDISKSKFNISGDFYNIKFKSGVVLNSKSSPNITVGYGEFFKNSMDINVSPLSKITKEFKGAGYRGFYGCVEGVSFSENGKHRVLINYTENEENFLLFLYKARNSFFVIMVDSKKPLDESILKIFNLK